MKSVKQICEETIGGKFMHGGKLKAATNKLYSLMITTELIKNRGDRPRTAAALEITRESLNWNIRRLGLDVEKIVLDGCTWPSDKKPPAAVAGDSTKAKHG